MYRLKIKVKNKMFVVRGKPVRTPVVIENLSKKDLDFYLSKIRLESIRDRDFEIEEMDKNNRSTRPNRDLESRINDEIESNDIKEGEQKVEELNEDKTTLDNILEDDE